MLECLIKTLIGSVAGIFMMVVIKNGKVNEEVKPSSVPAVQTTSVDVSQPPKAVKAIRISDLATQPIKNKIP
jgi:hypothetical protein